MDSLPRGHLTPSLCVSFPASVGGGFVGRTPRRREDEHFGFSGSCGLVAGCRDIPLYLGDYFCLIHCRSMFILQVFILERALFTRLFLCDTHTYGDVCFAGTSHSSPHTHHTHPSCDKWGVPSLPGPHQPAPSPPSGSWDKARSRCKVFSGKEWQKPLKVQSPPPCMPEDSCYASHLRHLNPSSAEAPSSSPGPRSPSHGGRRSSPSWWSCTSTDPTAILLQPHAEVLDKQANGVSMPSLWGQAVGLSYFFRDIAHQVAPSLT